MVYYCFDYFFLQPLKLEFLHEITKNNKTAGHEIMTGRYQLRLTEILEHLWLVVLLVVLGRALAAWTSRATVVAAWASVVVTTWATVVAAVVVTTRTAVSARLALRLDISLRLLHESLA